MIRNIVFDIGEVLLTYDWEGYLGSFGYSEELYQTIAQAMFLHESWNDSDLGIYTREELSDRFAANAPEAESEIRKVFAGAGRTIIERPYGPSWVKELKNRGFHVYYLSNFSEWCHADAREIMDKFLSGMDGGVFSYKVHMLKPEPEIYRTLLEQYGLKPEECLFIDDRRENIDGARAVGMNGLQFTAPEAVWEHLMQLEEPKQAEAE